MELRRDYGVSPVIATILLVAITIVLITTMYVFVVSNLLQGPYSTDQLIGSMVMNPDTSNGYNVNFTISLSKPQSAAMNLAKIGIYYEGNYTMLNMISQGVYDNMTSDSKWYFKVYIIDSDANNRLTSGDGLYIKIVDVDPTDSVVPQPFKNGDYVVLSIKGYNGIVKGYITL